MVFVLYLVLLVALEINSSISSFEGGSATTGSGFETPFGIHDMEEIIILFFFYTKLTASGGVGSRGFKECGASFDISTQFRHTISKTRVEHGGKAPPCPNPEVVSLTCIFKP